MVSPEEDVTIKEWNALPRALTWTTKPPKVAGWYYTRHIRHKDEASIMYISGQLSKKMAAKGPSEFIQFAGPIPAPLD